MPFRLASKETILQKLSERDSVYFEQLGFIEGEPIDYGDYNSPARRDWISRRNPPDGSAPRLTAEEQADFDVRNSAETVENRNEGDGAERYITYYFAPYDLYISMSGYYSSYGESTWNEMFVAKPYIYTEIHYKPLTEPTE